VNRFSEFDLLSTIKYTIEKKKFLIPTEIQAQVIPLLMSGQSVVGVSETGSGKTLAYALPLLDLIKKMEIAGDLIKEGGAPRAIIMTPTRELGEQVSKVLKSFTHDTRIRVRVALGGMTLEQARKNVGQPFEVLLATPGRLVQLIRRMHIRLDDVRMLVFDEADQMLDENFLADSNLIVSLCKKNPQLALFSATVSTTVEKLITSLFSKAVVKRSSGSGKVVPTLSTKNLTVVDGKRWPLFSPLLEEKLKGGTLIFTNTREQCDKLAKEMNAKHFNCVVYRGEMDKKERRKNLKDFREGKSKFLISTDLASRGLDLDYVDRVINYHLPQDMDNYIHRVGRTARAGRKGLVINLVTERDLPLISKLSGKPKSKVKT
jgi:ATP-dependent RNA helicase RhlE